MINVTVRNIPDGIMRKLKALSVIERRSLNSEILVVIEKGLSSAIGERETRHLSGEMQVELWKKVCGSWEDDRSTREIIDDIYANRTLGRDIKL